MDCGGGGLEFSPFDSWPKGQGFNASKKNFARKLADGDKKSLSYAAWAIINFYKRITIAFFSKSSNLFRRFWPQMARVGLILPSFSIIFPTTLYRGVIRTNVSRVAPDWDVRKTLYRLSYSAAANHRNKNRAPLTS